jgi:hypothetical protein
MKRRMVARFEGSLASVENVRKSRGLILDPRRDPLVLSLCFGTLWLLSSLVVGGGFRLRVREE